MSVFPQFNSATLGFDWLEGREHTTLELAQAQLTTRKHDGARTPSFWKIGRKRMTPTLKRLLMSGVSISDPRRDFARSDHTDVAIV